MNYSYIDIDFNNESYDIKKHIERYLCKYGMSLNFYSDIAFSLETVKKLLGFNPNDLILVRLSNDFDKNIALKNLLCECFNSFLVKNSSCSFAIESYLRLYNGVIEDPKNFENESLVPDGAEPLTSDQGFVQGYMLNYKNINFVFLPPELEQIEDVLNNKLSTIFARLYKLPTEFLHLKTFGQGKDSLSKILLPFINNSMGITLNIIEENLDALITIGYTKNNSREELDDFVYQVCESIKKYLYATEDISIEKTALDLIQLTRTQVSLVESITRGKLYYNLSSIDNECVHSNILYHKVVSELSDVFEFNVVDKNQLTTNGLYTIESTYEIATAIINETNAGLVVGSIGKYDQIAKSLTCFLAIGDIDGVHIYKNVYKGALTQLQDIICKNTCFYIIRKLKQNNLLFDQIL